MKGKHFKENSKKENSSKRYSSLTIIQTLRVEVVLKIIQTLRIEVAQREVKKRKKAYIQFFY